jgi:hypothetical protein
MVSELSKSYFSCVPIEVDEVMEELMEVDENMKNVIEVDGINKTDDNIILSHSIFIIILILFFYFFMYMYTIISTRRIFLLITYIRDLREKFLIILVL